MTALILEFDHVHSSGRFDQSPEEFEVEIEYYQDLCQALSVTEIDKNSRARKLESKTWNGTWGDRGPRDDCGVASKRSKFEVLLEETRTLSHRTYINERGERTDTTECAFQVVRDKVTGRLVLLGSVHTPHGMQPELRSGKIRSDVAKAYIAIERAYIRHATELMKWHGIRYAALSGDWNLNYRFAWVRAFFRKTFKGWTVNWASQNPLPSHGTHNREIIDATLLKGLRVRGRINILRNFKNNDHTAYRETLVEK